MVTAVTSVSSAAPATDVSQTQQPALSAAAQATLDKIGEMHTNFVASANEAVDVKKSAPADVSGASEVDRMAQMTDSISESMRTAAMFQNQIVQFAMATSISQSLGNNLNSFLKGS